MERGGEGLRTSVKYGVLSPKFIWAPVYSCTHWLRPCNPPPPAFGLIYEGAIGQPIGLCNPLIENKTASQWIYIVCFWTSWNHQLWHTFTTGLSKSVTEFYLKTVNWGKITVWGINLGTNKMFREEWWQTESKIGNLMLILVKAPYLNQD